MAIAHADYDALISRLETQARHAPGLYRLRVGLLAALGYAYVLIMLALVLALLTGIIWAGIAGHISGATFKFVILLGGFALVIVRSLWVTIPAPKGLELQRAQAPQLFALADELTDALTAPRIHTTLITNDFNAAVAQVPRLGIFGWPHNYLLVGLPLMQALTPEQFRAVLAHELGHLSGRHGRFAGWIYRVRQTWLQLMARLERDRRWGTGLFSWFLNWYAPYFNAYSFVLARRQEYEADAAAARFAGPQVAAETLIDVELKAAYLDESYWPEVASQAATQPEPVAGAIRNLATALKDELPPTGVAQYLAHALAVETGHTDTHPALAARLAALNYPQADNAAGHEWAREYRPAQVTESAAEHYLQQAHGETVARLDAAWAETIGPSWRDRHRKVRKERARLQALDEKAAAQALTVREAWERAYLTAEHVNADAALPLVQTVVELNPKHAEAQFALGRLLLARDDEAGVPHVEKSMDLSAQFIIPGCQILYAYHEQRGQLAEAERYRARAVAYYQAKEAQS